MFVVKWPSIQSVTPSTSGSPGEITRDSEWTVVGVEAASDGTHNYVQLPSGCDVGDVVEVQIATSVGQNIRVQPPSGEDLIGGGSDLAAPGFFRKVTSTVWSVI